MSEVDWWERVLKFGIIWIMFCFGVALLVVTYKLAKADDEFVWVHNPNGNEMVIMPERFDGTVTVEIDEDRPDEHYSDREILKQEEDIEQWWEEDYRAYLRNQGVDENLMRGW